MLSESQILLPMSIVRYIDKPSGSCFPKNPYQNEKDLIREKIAQQLQKNMSQNEQDLMSEPISNSLQPRVRRTCYHEIALKMRKI